VKKLKDREDRLKLNHTSGTARVKWWSYHAARITMGAVFVFASFDKILKPEAFAQMVYNYQILPESLVNLAALVLPWLELLLGLCLLLGFWLPGATMLGAGLMAMFIGALVFNQIRGLDVHCGCFSTDTTAGPAGWGTVARDLVFLLISVYLAVSVLIYRSPAAMPSRHHAELLNDPDSGGRHDAF
jgi:uncharacterized membrane protein YphA (DoxX/SURF4 family)